MQKNEEDIAIFFNYYPDEPISGTDIVKLLPILKRANWMVRRNSYEKRIEILVWIDNDIKWLDFVRHPAFRRVPTMEYN